MKKYLYTSFVMCLGLLGAKCEKDENHEMVFEITNATDSNYNDIKIYSTDSQEYFDSLTFAINSKETKTVSWSNPSLKKGDGNFLVKVDDLSTYFGYYSGNYISNLNQSIEIKSDTIIVRLK